MSVYKFSCWDDKNSLKLDYSNGCVIWKIPSKSLNCPY